MRNHLIVVVTDGDWSKHAAGHNETGIVIYRVRKDIGAIANGENRTALVHLPAETQFSLAAIGNDGLITRFDCHVRDNCRRLLDLGSAMAEQDGGSGLPAERLGL